KDATIRTSIIGPELKVDGEGLFHWFMMQKGEVKGFRSAIWSGVTTLELAKAIDKVIENNLSGLIHLTNGESIDKFTLLSLIKEIWGKNDISIVADNKHMVNKSLKKTDKFDFEVPSYRKMLLELQKWMINHENIYKQYI
ncbi:MAG TPA: SDR family NAD(P)-dependent oxidoreductase, partial [Gallicola sp.]|nr:SDR family NAD(P)-dependent oxidoreductase [Gallicola sp.]